MTESEAAAYAEAAATASDVARSLASSAAGEYVIEIHRVIESNVDCLGQESYVRFVAENPVFMEATRQRIVSYWDCYFRHVAPKIQDHLAFRVWEALNLSRPVEG